MCSVRKLKFGAVEAMPAVTGQSQKLTFVSSQALHGLPLAQLSSTLWLPGVLW